MMNKIKLMKSLITSFVLLSGLVLAQVASAETAVIVHPSNADSFSPKDIQRIFLGKQKSFPGGADAIPVDQNKGTPAREAFYQNVLSKTEQQVKAYWSRLVFTGKGTPPKEMGDSAAIVGVVSQNPNTIGYVDASAVDGSVKVVHKF